MLTPLESNILGALLARFEFGDPLQSVADVIGEVNETGVVNPDPQLLSVTQAAKFLGIPRATAYRAARRGQIPILKVGKTDRVPRAALLQWLSQGQAPSPRRGRQ